MARKLHQRSHRFDFLSTFFRHSLLMFLVLGLAACGGDVVDGGDVGGGDVVDEEDVGVGDVGDVGDDEDAGAEDVGGGDVGAGDVVDEEDADLFDTYIVTPTAGANGSISPDSAQTVNDGDTIEFTITPDGDYEIDSVTGCDGVLDGDTYVTGAITADCTVEASFKELSPEAPSLSLTPRAVKTFGFGWDDISGATEYHLLEDPDGMSGYTEVASFGAGETSHDLEVFLPERINASYVLQACGSGGCSESDAVAVSGSLAEAVGYVKASNTGENDRFGASVALSADGSTLAVGAMHESSDATGVCAPGEAGCDTAQASDDAVNSGAVYVFIRDGGIWSQQAYIKASNTEAGDRFGEKVALSDDGNTLAVGAIYESSDATGTCAPGASGCDAAQANNDADRSGAVYVFTRSGTTWLQQSYIKASNTDEDDRFGQSIALSADGNTLAVGAVRESSSATGTCAPGESDCDFAQTINSIAHSGAVYVFTRSGTTWSQEAYVKASNTGSGHRFGTSVALSADGSTLAVGATFEKSNATGTCAPGESGCDAAQGDDSLTGAGAVYVFTRSGTTWSQEAYVKASNTGENDYFGSDVALSADGNTLAVGAYGEDSDATGIDGDQDNSGAPSSGAVYVFTRSGTTWSQEAYVKASNTGSGDRFGLRVALTADGNTLAVGAYQEKSDAIGIGGDESNDDTNSSGAVYVFTRSGTSWSQEAYVKASNTGEYHYFGFSVALSAEGNTLAVGADREDSNATGIDGDQTNHDADGSGAVYLY